MKLRYKSIFYFFLLSSFLLICFFLRAVDRRFEVFPSVTLPSFASQTQTDKEVNISEKELYGIDSDGNRKRLNHTLFFKDIPIHFSHYIMANNFGLDADRPKKNTTGRFSINYTRKLKVTAKEIIKTKEWLQTRLREQHCGDSVLIIAKRKITINKNGTYNFAKFVENDTIYKLH